MDNATAATCIRSQLDDIDTILQGHNTEAEGNGDSDARLALQMYQEDIKAREMVLQDRRIACSIGAAVASDGDLIEEARREGYICSRDQQITVPLGEQRDSRVAPNELRRRSEAVDDALAALNRDSQIPTDYVFPVARGVSDVGKTEPKELCLVSAADHHVQASFDLEKSRTHLESDFGSVQLGQPSLQSTIKENAIWGSLMSPTTPKSVENVPPKSPLTTPTSTSTASDTASAPNTCTSCGDDGLSEDMINTTCGHSYCLECTIQYVQVSLRPDSIFPPSCCDLPLTLAMIQDHISLDVMRQYTAKQDEIANACSLRCAQPSCKTMIPLENIEESKGRCPVCHQNTCRNCKLVWHGSDVCKEGKEREEIVKLAKEKGWQFCFMCRNCVGISHGCNHITSVQWSKVARDARLMVLDAFAKRNFATSAA